MKIILSLFTILLISANLDAQIISNNTIKDSLLAREARKLKNNLSLTNTQYLVITSIIKSHFENLEKIRNVQYSDSNRIIAIKELLKVKKRQMKAALTPQQFNSYKLLIQTNKNNFQLHQTQRNIRVVPIVEE